MTISWNDSKRRRHHSIQIIWVGGRHRCALKAITEVSIRRTIVFIMPMPLFVWNCEFVSFTLEYSFIIHPNFPSVLQNRTLVPRNRNEFAVQHFRVHETENRNFHYAEFRLQLSFWCRKIPKWIPTWRSQIRMVTRTVSWLVRVSLAIDSGTLS